MIEIPRDRRPLYLVVKEILLKMIQEGEYSPGHLLPPTAELVKKLGVSRATVREALKVLEDEGIIASRQGVGTFVVRSWVHLSTALNQLQSTTEMAQAWNLKLTNKVMLLDEAPASPELSSKLDVQEGEAVVILERLRFAEDKPVIYSTDIFPRNIIRFPLKREYFEGSLFSLLQEQCGVEISRSLATIIPVPPGGDIGRVLGTKRNVPFLLLEQINYDTSNRPILFSKDYYRGDLFKFQVNRKKY